MKNALIGLFILGFCLLSTSPAFAAGTVSCQPIYGGGQTCAQTGNVAINKTVKNPQTGKFVDNLDINDPKFNTDQATQFQITITNTGSTTMSNISVKDIFPQFVLFMAGNGSFDSNTKTLSFDVNNLNPNESKTFDITGKIVSKDKLPTDRGVICVINQGIATSSNTGQTSQDNSQLCIQKQVTTQVPTTTKGGLKVFPPTPVTTAPSTGPEMIPLIALIPTGLAGLILRRKTKKTI